MRKKETRTYSRSVFVSSRLSIHGTNATCCHVQVTQRRKKQRKYKGQTTIVRTTTQLRRRKKRDGKWSIFVLQKSVCKTVLPIFSFCFGFSGLERRRCSIGKETFKNSTFFVLDFVSTDVRFWPLPSWPGWIGPRRRSRRWSGRRWGWGLRSWRSRPAAGGASTGGRPPGGRGRGRQGPHRGRQKRPGGNYFIENDSLFNLGTCEVGPNWEIISCDNFFRFIA